MPRDFGVRYILWLGWTNALTIICTLQLIFLYVTSDHTLDFSDKTSHQLLGLANVLGIIAAQIKRKHPPDLSPPRRRR